LIAKMKLAYDKMEFMPPVKMTTMAEVIDATAWADDPKYSEPLGVDVDSEAPFKYAPETYPPIPMRTNPREADEIYAARIREWFKVGPKDHQPADSFCTPDKEDKRPGLYETDAGYIIRMGLLIQVDEGGSIFTLQRGNRVYGRPVRTQAPAGRLSPPEVTFKEKMAAMAAKGQQPVKKVVIEQFGSIVRNDVTINVDDPKSPMAEHVASEVILPKDAAPAKTTPPGEVSSPQPLSSPWLGEPTKPHRQIEQELDNEPFPTSTHGPGAMVPTGPHDIFEDPTNVEPAAGPGRPPAPTVPTPAEVETPRTKRGRRKPWLNK
jgi:hypothetical protein